MADRLNPPKFPLRFLHWFCKEDFLDEVEGDLVEYYSREYSESPVKAKINFTVGVLKHCRPEFIKSFRFSISYTNTSMFKNYFKIAFRNLARNKVYSVINIAGLSLGLACAILILLYVKDEVSYDRFQKNIANTFLVGRKMVDNKSESVVGTDGYTGYVQGPEFKSAIPGVKSFVRMVWAQKNFKRGTDVISQQVYLVDSNFFLTFTFPLLYGNAKTALSDPHDIVISEDMAKEQFGTTEVIGKTIEISNESGFTPYIVSAVARNCPQNSSIKFRMLLPLTVSAADLADAGAWNTSVLNTFIELNPRADRNQVNATMEKISRARNEAADKLSGKYEDNKWSSIFLLQPFTKLHLSTEYRAYELSDASEAGFSYILTGIAFFILAIACINFVNLTIARSVKRAKEIGVRKVVGGERKQLILQFLGESFFLCTLAFLAALLFVQLVLPVFNELAGKRLALSYLLDWQLIVAYSCLYLITGFLAGLYPAIILSSYKPVDTLYNSFVISGKNFLQKSLVVIQFTLSSALIIATLTIVSQFNYLTSKELGYDDKNLIVINNWGMSAAQVDLFREELMKTPGIIGVSSKDMGWDNGQTKVGNGIEVAYVRETVDENFIPLLKVPVIRGRNFSKAFGTDSAKAVLINETFAKQAGWANPIGQQINLGNDKEDKFSVIGVVKDYFYQPLDRVIKAQVFTIKPGRVLGNLLVKINPVDRSASLRQVETIFKKIFPLAAYVYFFKEQENLANYASEAKWKQILTFSALLTIFISCIGLFGLSVLAAEKRTKEIGIRKVLGASTGSLVSILSTEFLKLVSISLLIAIPFTAVAASRWLENYAYRIQLGWGIFAMAALLVIGVALTTVSFQAVKAALSNPVKSLRTQ